MSGPLKIGLIGAGRISGRHVEAAGQFPDRLRFAAVCDVDESAARTRAGEAGAAELYRDGLELIRDADVEAVDICTLADTHAQYAIAAAEAGKHVLIEKPMAATMRQCRDIVSACEKSGVTLMVAQNQRYKANYRAVRRAIREGQIGEVRSVRVESLGHTQSAPGHWIYDARRAGGGVVMTLAVHRIDLARYFVGEIRRVTAICRTTRPEFVHGAEDWAWALMEFANGAVGELFTTWSAYRMPWGESFIIFGQRGTVHALPVLVSYREPALIASDRHWAPPPANRSDKTWKTRGFVPLQPDAEGLPTGEMYVDEVLHFADCCATGQPPISSGRDNLGTMRTVFGIYEAARRGATVDLDEVCPL